MAAGGGWKGGMAPVALMFGLFMAGVVSETLLLVAAGSAGGRCVGASPDGDGTKTAEVDKSIGELAEKGADEGG